MPSKPVAGLSRPCCLMTKAALKVPRLRPQLQGLLPSSGHEVMRLRELHPMLPVLPDLLSDLPSCLFLWQRCLNTVKFGFKHLSCPAPPQYPFPCGITSPVPAPLHCGCSCWGSSVLTGAPLPTPLPSILITNVHNSVFVISMCCLRSNYTICSGLTNAAHLLCEKQFRNPSLTSAGAFLL